MSPPPSDRSFVRATSARATSARTPSARATSAFSRPIDVDKIPDDGWDISIEADPAECLAIAREIGVPALAALVVSYRIVRSQGGRVQVAGKLASTITQVCVVSLEPFESDVSQPIDIVFAPTRAPSPDRRARQRRAADVSRRDVGSREPPALMTEGEADPPDPIIDGRIDLGAVAVEFLTLALDFYPKKPGVHFSDAVIGETEDPEPSAFAALGRFKDQS